jgi:hypothetical protein
MKNITVEEYNNLIAKINFHTFKETLRERNEYKDKLDKIKEYCEGYIEKEDSYYGTIYAVKSEFHEILQIIESDSE